MYRLSTVIKKINNNITIFVIVITKYKLKHCTGTCTCIIHALKL